jgi:hypothetical protein
MKCKYCIYYIEKKGICEIGKCKDTCRSFRSIGQCLKNCAECENRYNCDTADREENEINIYIKNLTRYSEV